MAYLARYTHRTAIANSRLVAVDDAEPGRDELLGSEGRVGGRPIPCSPAPPPSVGRRRDSRVADDQAVLPKDTIIITKV